MVCKKCGSTDIDFQVFQENKSSKTITREKSKYKEKGHGILWWLTIGWWWIADLFLWIFFFLPRFCIELFKKKKYTGKSKSVSKTRNQYEYRKVCVCRNCGYKWKE